MHYYKINIDAPVKDKILNALENNNENLPDYIVDVQTYIFDTLREDSFPRFLQCKEFKDWDEYKKSIEENLKSN